ncbi:MAG: 30S ribosomal protein S4 [Candidatus Odinarchaeota archaeon]
MGSPRRLRKKVIGPRHPFNAEQIEAEMKIAGEYGLRNKKEIWKLRTILRRYRQRARQMLALPEEDRYKQESILLEKLTKLAVVPPDATLDYVLDLQDNDFLNRRLQTIVYKLGLASTIHQARQFIVHGHISLNGRRVTTPNYHVKLGEEDRITYTQSSPIYNESHPIRRVISELGPGLGPSGKSEFGEDIKGDEDEADSDVGEDDLDQDTKDLDNDKE